jgi:hypothetical protein
MGFGEIGDVILASYMAWDAVRGACVMIRSEKDDGLS